MPHFGENIYLDLDFPIGLSTMKKFIDSLIEYYYFLSTLSPTITNSLFKKEYYFEAVNLLRKDLSEIYPENIIYKYNELMELFQDENNCNIYSLQELWDELKQLILYYHEKQSDYLRLHGSERKYGYSGANNNYAINLWHVSLSEETIHRVGRVRAQITMFFKKHNHDF